MEVGEPSTKANEKENASILVRTLFNAFPLADIEVELRPGGVRRTDAKGECTFARLAPGRYEVLMKGNTVWTGRVRETDELKINVVATASYARCCHISSASPAKENV